MAAEARVQAKLIKYLNDKGCYVVKTKPGMGTPVGCPDVFAFYEGFWAAFECKANKNAGWKPLQKETLDLLAQWSFVWVVYPENLDSVITELEDIL